MIRRVHIENYKCFRDFDVELEPFTVIIGPNDSGKTAFFESLSLADAVSDPNIPTTRAEIEKRMQMSLKDDIHWQKQEDLQVMVELFGGDESKTHERFMRVSMGRQEAAYLLIDRKKETREESHRPKGDTLANQLRNQVVGRMAVYRLNPSSLKQRGSYGHWVLGRDGCNLPSFLDRLLREDRCAFLKLEKLFSERFPDYVEVIIRSRTDNAGYSLAVRMRSGACLPISSISDGAVLSLAYLAIASAEPVPNLLLFEEPENGVHHTRLREIVQTLRDLTLNHRVQVLLTTHSPYLLDLVEAHEIRVFAKDEVGAVHAKKMSDYPEVDRLKKHFMSGEIWTGLSEEEIVLSGEKPSE